jgi:hypothetical protein
MDGYLMAARAKETDEDILKEGRKRFERCVVWESTARANALNDSRFAAGDSYNMYQWDPRVQAARAGRPMLTMNKARQHNLHIVNDARQHKAQAKVTPTGGSATYEAAQVFAGVVRRIEYQSKAVDAYSTAIFHQVDSGIGYVHVETDYADEDSFDQEIFIRREPNPRSIYLDPDAKDYDKADMRFAFKFIDTPRDLYEELHGEGDMPAPATLDHTSDGWNDTDHIREAQYWRRNESTTQLHLLLNGQIAREKEIPDGDMGELVRRQIVKSRDIAVPEIECFRIVGNRIDKREVWPGKYIPIVPFIGEETVIEGVMDRKGHTRALLDSQRMYNVWGSAAVEQVGTQGKSPYIASARAIEGHKAQWDSANTTNWPYLLYNDTDPDDPNAPPPQKPERTQPPVMAQAYIEGMNIAREDMMMVSGQYQAEMGQPGNERSRVAIAQRQRESDTATYHYTDNQSKGIRHVCRIVVDLIPKVYDVARVMKIMAEDGTDSDVHLMPNAPEAHQHVQMTLDGPRPISPEQAEAINEDPDQPDAKVIFNPNVGRYDVEADVGPSFGTQRQEAANAFSEIMAQNPAAFTVLGDMWARNSDFPGADELAERLKKGLPPQYQPGTDPQVEALKQAMQQQGAHASQLLGKADAEIATHKAHIVTLEEQAKDRAAELKIKDYEAETDRLKAVGGIDPESLKIIVRQMVEQMLQTDLEPMLQRHAAIEQSLVPPEPEPAAASPQ